MITRKDIEDLKTLVSAEQRAEGMIERSLMLDKRIKKDAMMVDLEEVLDGLPYEFYCTSGKKVIAFIIEID